MEFTFNPTIADDRDAASEIIALFDAMVDNSTTAPASTAANVAATIAATTPLATTPEPTTVAAIDPNTPVDSHGMIHNTDYHSTPAKQNGDGTWKVKRGCKDVLAAAIVAHKNNVANGAGSVMAQSAIQPETVDLTTAGQAMAQTGMPQPNNGMPMPGSATPNTPVEPLTYGAVSARFVGMCNIGRIVNFEPVYVDMQISYDDLQTNQTSLQKLHKYMNAIEAGADHPTAVAAGLSA